FERLVYTDDTQMAIGVAEALLARERPTIGDYAQAYVANYQPWRGYGRGARFVLERIAEGVAPEAAAVEYFPDGSFGNGAAMRAAPVALRFGRDTAALLDQARASSLPTHTHPLGVDGATLIARAAALALETARFERAPFFEALLATPLAPAFAAKLERARALAP